MRQRQLMPAGRQRVQQREQVPHVRRVEQRHVLRRRMRDAQALEHLRQHPQPFALARQHEHVAGLHLAVPQQRRDAGGDAPGLRFAPMQFRLAPRLGQARAPGVRVARGRGGFLVVRLVARDEVDAVQRIAAARLGGVGPEAGVLLRQAGLLEHRVHRRQHWRRVAPRVVAGQQHAVQAFADEVPRRGEDARFGASEAVDALLGIAHDEHRGRPLSAGAATGADITRQPRVQRVPLQRAGVLEFVDQQVSHLAVQPLLHPARQLGVAEQRQRTALEVVHVDEAALPLQALEGLEQRQREPAHLLVPGARVGLVQRQLQPGEPVAQVEQQRRVAQRLDQRALLREQLGAHRGERAGFSLRLVPGRRQRHLQGHRRGLLRLVPSLPQLGGERLQLAAHRGEGVDRIGERGQFGHHLGRRRHAVHQSTVRLRQAQLDALVEGRQQPVLQLVAAVDQAELAIDRQQRFVRQHGRVEALPELGHQVGLVLQQLQLGRQPLRTQQFQRRGAQQLGEPGVEGADLHRPRFLQQALLQRRQPGSERLGLGLRQAPLAQREHAARVVAMGELMQPLVQAGAHLASRLAGEGDRDDVLRPGAVQQRAQDARHQHPGLARAGAGLDDDAACRIAGQRVEALAGDRRAVEGVGGRGAVEGAGCDVGRHVRRAGHGAAPSQSSRRHRPRISQ